MESQQLAVNSDNPPATPAAKSGPKCNLPVSLFGSCCWGSMCSGLHTAYTIAQERSLQRTAFFFFFTKQGTTICISPVIYRRYADLFLSTILCAFTARLQKVSQSMLSLKRITHTNRDTLNFCYIRLTDKYVDNCRKNNLTSNWHTFW